MPSCSTNGNGMTRTEKTLNGCTPSGNGSSAPSDFGPTLINRKRKGRSLTGTNSCSRRGREIHDRGHFMNAYTRRIRYGFLATASPRISLRLASFLAFTPFRWILQPLKRLQTMLDGQQCMKRYSFSKNDMSARLKRRQGRPSSEHPKTTRIGLDRALTLIHYPNRTG